MTMLPQHLQLNINLNSNPYLIDQLQFMQQQESSYYQIVSTHDYFAPSWVTATPKERRTMASWSYDIVDACSINREIAVIGMSYFDRFMSTSTSTSCQSARAALTNRREFQLAFLACLIVALKCRAGMQVNSDFVANTICQGLYQEVEINAMEKAVLDALEWRLNGPSPHEFIDGLLELLPPSSASSPDGGVDFFVKRMKTMAKIQVEVAMLDHSLARIYSPSSIAYEALLSSMNNIDAITFYPLDRLAWMQNIAMVTGMNANDAKHRQLRDQLSGVVQQHLFPSSSSVKHTENDDDTNINIRTTSIDREEFNRCSSTAVVSSTSSIETEFESVVEECDYDELYTQAISTSWAL